MTTWDDQLKELWEARRNHSMEVYEKASRGIISDSTERVQRYLNRAHARGGPAALANAAVIAEGAHREEHFERQIGTQDQLTIEYLEGGLCASLPVGRITTPLGTGTGFLVGCGLMMTNHHVLLSGNACGMSSIELNVEENRIGRARPIESFELLPERFFYTCPEIDLTLVAVAPHSEQGTPLERFGSLPLRRETGKILVGQRVNLIGHPTGGSKQIAIRDNRLLSVEETLCLYSCDSDAGSSGSPVLNDDWEVIGLHSRSISEVSKSDGPGPGVKKWVANAGIRASVIVKHLANASLNKEQRTLCDELVGAWETSSRFPAPSEEPVAVFESSLRQEVGIRVCLKKGERLIVEGE